MKKVQNLSIKFFITALSFILLSSNTKAQSTVVRGFFQTCNVYRTWTKGQERGGFQNLKWQVKFETTENTIEQYWEKDGFPLPKFKLYQVYEVVSSEQTQNNNYVYKISNLVSFIFNSNDPSSVIITKDGGKTFTEYATYNSYYNKFE